MKNLVYLCHQSNRLAKIRKCFRTVLTENVEVFRVTNRRIALISCLEYDGAYFLCATPTSIQVWGIASFIVTWVFPQPSVR